MEIEKTSVLTGGKHSRKSVETRSSLLPVVYVGKLISHTPSAKNVVHANGVPAVGEYFPAKQSVHREAPEVRT